MLIAWSNHRLAMSIAILRASNGLKMSEIFTNKETLLSEKRKGKSEKSKCPK